MKEQEKRRYEQEASSVLDKRDEEEVRRWGVVFPVCGKVAVVFCGMLLPFSSRGKRRGSENVQGKLFQEAIGIYRRGAV